MSTAPGLTNIKRQRKVSEASVRESKRADSERQNNRERECGGWVKRHGVGQDVRRITGNCEKPCLLLPLPLMCLISTLLDIYVTRATASHWSSISEDLPPLSGENP
jgi:hypothetical protein